MNTGLDQYMDIFKDAVEDSAAKLTKSFEKILIEVIILFMVIPRKINFTQMGRYGSHVEQTYRNAFGLKKSKSIDWLKLNVSLAKRFFGKQGRWAIAIDPSYISKAGKKTPHIGRFWSGCAQSVKHGLEIMGIGLFDIDTKDCMMLRAHQSLSNKNPDADCAADFKFKTITKKIFIDGKEKKPTEKEIISFIKEMYNGELYNDYDFLKKHCTKSLLKHLAAEYDYDDGGYATWLFRSGLQDGPSERHGNKG